MCLCMCQVRGVCGCLSAAVSLTSMSLSPVRRMRFRLGDAAAAVPGPAHGVSCIGE